MLCTIVSMLLVFRNRPIIGSSVQIAANNIYGQSEQQIISHKNNGIQF